MVLDPRNELKISEHLGPLQILGTRPSGQCIKQSGKLYPLSRASKNKFQPLKLIFQLLINLVNFELKLK